MEAKITTFIPYEADAKLDCSYNECMSGVPDDGWGCFIDHDAMFTTVDWFLQLQQVIKENPQYDCFTVVTNRIYNEEQAIKIDQDNHNMRYHRAVGASIQKENGSNIKDITTGAAMSGVVILIKKSAWQKCKFRPMDNGSMYGIDGLFHKDLKEKGFKVGIMLGVYVYHWYRDDALDIVAQTQNGGAVIAMPLRADGTIHIATAQFCTRSIQRGHAWRCQPGLEPNMSRNMLILKLLHETVLDGSTHLFFLDADTIPPDDALDKLIALDVDVACGVVPIFKGVPVWNVQINGDGFVTKDKLPEEPFEIKRTGAACMLVKRDVFKKLSWPYFRLNYEPPSIEAFLTGSLQKVGGDVYFCDNIIEHGFKIWADPKVQCGHQQTMNLQTFI